MVAAGLLVMLARAAGTAAYPDEVVAAHGLVTRTKGQQPGMINGSQVRILVASRSSANGQKKQRGNAPWLTSGHNLASGPPAEECHIASFSKVLFWETLRPVSTIPTREPL